MWTAQGAVGAVRWGFTDVEGGVSAPPYAGLNLGLHVGDDEAAVRENRRRLAHAWGVGLERFVFMDQCHGADVAVVGEPGAPPSVDAVVTTTPGVTLVVMVADCVPVLLADEVAGVVGAVHAGRPGMMKGVVGQAVSAMRDEGATSLRAWVGPAVCGRCYEVEVELRAQAAAVVPESATVSWTGTAAIDVPGAVVSQLIAAGVSVQWLPGCTRERMDLYSHRRQAPTGRWAGLVMLDPERMP